MDKKEGLVLALQLVKSAPDTLPLCAAPPGDVPGQRFIVSLSLAEAETVRKLIHQGGALVQRTGTGRRGCGVTTVCTCLCVCACLCWRGGGVE